MKINKRPFAAVGAAALLAASLTACGGSAPADASEEDVCGYYTDFTDAFGEADADDYDAKAEAYEQLQSDMEEIGTPADISDEAREGFDLFVDALDEVDAGSLEEQAEADENDEDGPLDEVLESEEDEDKVDTFFEYMGETCAETSEPEDGGGEGASVETE